MKFCSHRRNAQSAHLLLALALVLAVPLSGHAESTDEQAHAHEHEHEEHSPVETIVVTASPLAHDRDELAIPVDRIDRDELLDNLGSTLGETLNHVPGIATTGFTAGASRPVIRGQDAFRTEVLEDSLRTHDVSRESPDHAVPVNPLVAERVEVVRGAAALRYGGGATAGVVNVITNRVPDRLGEEGLRGEVFGGIGLLANERDLAASLDGSKGNVAFHVDGLFRRANDYQIPNDDRPRIQTGTALETWMGSAGASYFGDWGRIGASYTRAENDYGIPEADEPVQIELHTDRFRFEGDFLPDVTGIREVRVRGVYSDYEHDEIADGDIGQTYRNEEFEGRIEVLHEPIFGFTGALGLHSSHRDFRAEGEAAEFLAPTETIQNALYFFEEFTFDNAVSLETGFRVEHVRVQGLDIAGQNRDLDFIPLSGSVGMTYQPIEWLTFGMTGSVSQRAPSQVELFARGPHEATGTFEIGDPDLDLETAYGFDYRIEAQGSRGRIEWSGFVTQYDSYIFAALTGATVNEDGLPPAAGDDSLDQLRYSDRDALFWGTEISAEFDLYESDWGVLGIDGRFDYVRARFDSAALAGGGGGDLPRIVPIRWGAGLSFAGEAFDARVGFIRTEPQQRPGAFENPTQSFTYLNASASYRLDLIDSVPLEFTVVGRNLNDVRGRNALSFNKDEVLLPGRSVRFGLRAQF